MNAAPPLSQLQAGAQNFIARYDRQGAIPQRTEAAAI